MKNKDTASIFFDLQEQQWQHNPYGHELRQQMSIRTGNVEALENTWHEEIIGKAGRLSSNKIRNTKNLAVIMISLAARSAIQGGLSAELAFSMADAAIFNIEENLFKEDDIFTAAHDSQVEFAQAVRNLGKGSEYNPLINQAKDYISRHIHEKISVAEIASTLGVHPNYLSGIFSKCENKTISQYILNEKVYLCQNMLKYSDKTIQEISAYFAFASQSYFAMKFKEVCGMSPNRYREMYRIKRL